MKLLLTTIKSECHSTELELRYLYGVVADAPIETDIRMYDMINLDLDIYNEIVRGQYNIVYFHVDENNERRVISITEMVKKALPSTIVVVGGIQVSFDSRSFLKNNPCVDYVIRGEGELVLFRFLRTLLTYEYDFKNIPGLAYRNDYDAVANPLDAFVSLEDLPFPYEKTEIYDTKRVYYETIRGTSDRSIYNQHYQDARIRALSLNRVCTELRYFLVKKVGTLVIMDKWFNYNVERAYRILEYIINNDNGITSFEINMDGDSIDDETIRLLSEAREGLFTFNFDIVSTNAETLSYVGRRENIYQLMYNVNRLMQASKVKVNLSITAGLPLETEQLFARSFNKVYGLAEGTSLSVDTMRIRKGSLLKDQAGKFGYIYCSYPPYEVIATGTLPAPDLIKIKTISKVLAKYDGGDFKNSLPKLMADVSLRAYDFFKKFTEYIYDNGYENKLDRKENCFRVLYAFAVSLYEEMNDTLKLQILMESLHEDLENALSEDEIKKFERKGWELETW